jgi:pre-mRNA-processing factor SLU7
LREDTAKYLLNLDLDSAKYDPKTRTMVDQGAVASHDRAAALFAEEGFLRASGDAEEFERAQRQAWAVQERTGDAAMHLQANPTSGAVARKKAEEEERRRRDEEERKLLEKYGGSGARDVAALTGSVPEQLRKMAVTESEHFVEYEESGAIKGAVKTKARSKYKEDVYINNHTAIWGSWWSNFRWGYACCHSFVKKSYCTGEAGRLAFEAAERQRTGVGLVTSGEEEAVVEEAANAREEGSKEEKKHKKKRRDRKEDDDDEKRADAPKKRTLEEMMSGISEADMDEYRKKRMAASDPMAKLLGRDELVH